MNIVTILHNKAMEFADEAMLAKMEGDNRSSFALFEKAFELEQEAAASVPEENQHSESNFLLIRSAAALAFTCGKFQEARALINAGLSGNLPAFIANELKDLEISLLQATNEKVGYLEIVGIITYANAVKSEVQLQDIQSKEPISITVPRHLINEIVKSYWGDLVQVKAKTAGKGAIILDEITRAA